MSPDRRAPLPAPRHASSAPDRVDRIMGALAYLTLAGFSVLLAGVFAGWWLA